MERILGLEGKYFISSKEERIQHFCWFINYCIIYNINNCPSFFIHLFIDIYRNIPVQNGKEIVLKRDKEEKTLQFSNILTALCALYKKKKIVCQFALTKTVYDACLQELHISYT